MFRRKITPDLNAVAIENLDKIIDKLEKKVDEIFKNVYLAKGAGLESRLNNQDDTIRTISKELTALKEWRVLKNSKVESKYDTVINVEGGSSSSIGRDVQGDVSRNIEKS